MNDPRDEAEARVNETPTIGRGGCGCGTGMIVGACLGLAGVLVSMVVVYALEDPADQHVQEVGLDPDILAWLFIGVLAVLGGAIIGAVLAGVIGRTLGEQNRHRGWAAPYTLTRTDRAIPSCGILQQQPPQPKCPFCHSTTFHIEQEAGSRRCSDCHSVLPNYIQGNR